jgi:hypothetical protein
VPRRRKQKQDEAPAEAEFIIQLTPNQVVAYNLAQARLWKDWTQEEAAEHLEPYLGSRWSKATFSAAERSVDGQRVRQFTGDEIVAFARGFGLPVGFFFLPPPPSAAPLPIKLASPQNPWSGIPMAELVDVVFGPLGEIGFMALRVEEFFRQSSMDMQTDVQRRLRLHTETVIEGVIKRDLGRFDDWRAMLMSLANQLEDWQIRSRRAATEEGVDDG